MAEAEALAFLRRGDHLKGLARAHDVGKKRVAAVEDVRDGVDLVGAQRDLRVDADKV